MYTEPNCSASPISRAPSAAPVIEPMPPTMTTTSDASRKRMSSPGARDWNVPPTTPARPASPAPKAKTATKTSWMRMPLAASMSRSSTPARIIIPIRVRLSSHHITTPMTTAAAKIARRTIGYFR